jgi:hypothetical protein
LRRRNGDFGKCLNLMVRRDGLESPQARRPTRLQRVPIAAPAPTHEADWLRESDLNERFVVMSHARGLVTAPVIPRHVARATNSLGRARARRDR